MKTKIFKAGAVLFCLLLLIFNESITYACLDGLSVSVKKVIPVLFPYMVVSSVIVYLDLAAPISRFVPMRLFSLPDNVAAVLITGIICGYPVGASGSAALYRSGHLSKDEAARLCALSSHVSPAFLVGTVGALWASKAFGWYLFVCGIIFTVISGFFFRKTLHCSASTGYTVTSHREHDFVGVLCQSITSAAASCLNVTGFIVFFRAAGTAFSSVIPQAEPLFSVLFEFSSGTVYSSSVGGIAGASLCGFAVGFSGLSVLAQTASFTAPHKIPLKPFIMSKLIEGIFIAAASALYFAIFGLDSASDVFMSAQVSYSPIVFAVLAALAAVTFAGVFLRQRNKFRMRT